MVLVKYFFNILRIQDRSASPFKVSLKKITIRDEKLFEAYFHPLIFFFMERRRFIGSFMERRPFIGFPMERRPLKSFLSKEDCSKSTLFYREPLRIFDEGNTL